MKTILLFAIAVAFAGCQKPSTLKPATTDEAAFKRPTATEVFNLRSKCAEFGEKVLNGNSIGPALTQEQVSHYDPKTNRCYVELWVHMADLTKFQDYEARYVFDGQTGEMLASAQNKKGVKTGFVQGGNVDSVLDFNAATLKIDGLMADDRKQ